MRIQISEWIGKFRIGSAWISIRNFRQGCKESNSLYYQTRIRLNEKCSYIQKWIRPWSSTSLCVHELRRSYHCRLVCEVWHLDCGSSRMVSRMTVRPRRRCGGPWPIARVGAAPMILSTRPLLYPGQPSFFRFFPTTPLTSTLSLTYIVYLTAYTVTTILRITYPFCDSSLFLFLHIHLYPYIIYHLFWRI